MSGVLPKTIAQCPWPGLELLPLDLEASTPTMSPPCLLIFVLGEIKATFYIRLVHDLSFRDLLKCFTTAELMRWSHIKEVYESELRTGSSATGVFEQATDEGKKRWEDLRKRVVEHVSACSYKFVFFCVISNVTHLFRILFLMHEQVVE